MKTSRAVVLRYARALLDLKDTKCIEMLKALASLNDERIHSFLNDPTVLPSFKAKTIASTFDIDEKCQRMLEIIFEHKRFKIFSDLYQIAWKLWLRENGKEHVIVRSAQSITDKEKESIVRVIREIRKSEPVLDVIEDKSLLAGVVIDFEDAIVDISAAGALKKAANLMYGG